MGIINKYKSGLAVGSLLGLWHLTWALLVALGVAQQLINWIFQLHFIQPPYTINPFQIGTAVTLVIITSVIGYIFGWLFAAIWNRLHPVSK